MPPTQTTLEATPGARFHDLRRSPAKLIEVVDSPAFNWQHGENGSIVAVASESTGKVYGPYKLDHEFCRGGGNIVFVGYSVMRAANGKPKSKEELFQENAQLLAKIAELEAKQ